VTSLTTSLNQFYQGKRVVVTGHTGLKGSWLALWLEQHGASVLGIALPPTSPLCAYSACAMGSFLRTELVDIRDHAALRRVFDSFKPEIVFHLAAQAIVGTSFEDPRGTFETNVQGSVNVLECIRHQSSVRVGVMITSDKCYDNVEQIWGYREVDRLGGDDPYSATKACAELAIRAYRESFFRAPGTANVASTRAGNVVGGGDWSQFRLVPDCVRALRRGTAITLRNPASTRPWQFVLDPLAGYMMLAQRLWTDGKDFSGPWNFGPAVDNNMTVERGTREIIRNWGSGDLEVVREALFHEYNLLQLDCAKSRHLLAWRPVLDFAGTMSMTTAWYKHQCDNGDASMLEFSRAQIRSFEALMERRTSPKEQDAQ
jgi:CDP-glucose 4,6-dehydratase